MKRACDPHDEPRPAPDDPVREHTPQLVRHRGLDEARRRACTDGAKMADVDRDGREGGRLSEGWGGARGESRQDAEEGAEEGAAGEGGHG